MDILTKIYHKQKQQSEIVNSFSDKKVSFDSSQMIISVETIIFDILSVRRAKFSKIHVNPVLSFLLSDLDEADFGKTYENLNFTYCNLTHTNFVCSSLLNPVFIGNNLAFTNMSHANLSNAHFKLMNNFSHADLRNALGITDDVFHSALSLDNTHLPNGTQIKDNPELVRNGHAKCNMSVSKDWRIEDGNISIQPSIKDPNSCYFVPVNISDFFIPRIECNRKYFASRCISP